jgi:hypothetical protein
VILHNKKIKHKKNTTASRPGNEANFSRNASLSGVPARGWKTNQQAEIKNREKSCALAPNRAELGALC